MIGLATPLSESPGESRCRWLFHQLGLPQPAQQVRFGRGDGSVFARVDFLFREARVIVEFDGLAKYGADGNEFRAEKVRERELQRLGYRVVRLTWADLAHPAAVLALLRDAGVRVA